MKDLLIREPNSDDLPFIYSTWLNSYKHDSDLGKSCRKSVFMEEYKQVIDRILNNQGTQVLFVCKSDEPNVLFGYIVADRSSIHYCYVKENFRRLGIATALRGGLVTKSNYFSHKTNHLKPILDRHPELIYNPFVLYAKGDPNV